MFKRLVMCLIFMWLVSSTVLAGEYHGGHEKIVIHKEININNTQNFNNYINETTEVTEVIEQEKNSFDYGPYLDLIFVETKNSEWGIKSSYYIDSEETRVNFGGKIYLNRIFGK